MQPDIDHVSHHHEIFGEFSRLNDPASVSFKLAGKSPLPSPIPPTPVFQLALSTLLGDDKNVKRETMTAGIWFYGLSPTRWGHETHPKATGRRGKEGVSTAKVTKVLIDGNKIK